VVLNWIFSWIVRYFATCNTKVKNTQAEACATRAS